MNRTKYIPALITLIGCLAASIITLLNHYSALKSMIVILVVLIVFYIAGLVVKHLADKYLVIEKEKIEMEADGEVAEADQSENTGDTETEKKDS